MNKRRKHADLIIAWANGEKIQEKIFGGGVSDAPVWVDQSMPRWVPEYEYRVKPREFEEGEWYPVKLINGDKAILVYDGRIKGFIGDTYCEYGDAEITWVGEKLSVDWPKRSK